MIIDFHTHVFPDRIASKTIEMLSQKGGIPPFSDGTTAGLLSEMEKAGVDISITLPVITNPAQFESVNRFAAELNSFFADKERRLISFGGIHPDCDDIDAKMKTIKDMGFLGVKLHPDYQGVFIDDERYMRIMECAREYDLIVITHSGVDTGFRGESVRCTPERALKLIRKVPHSKFVLAHYGANEMFDEVIEKLCGEDVYFDTAYILRFVGEEKFKKILEMHGEDKILFASDSPWSNIREDVNILKSYNLGKEVEEKIFSGNAKKLLGSKIR